MDTISVQSIQQPPQVSRFKFEGKGTEMFLIMLVNYLLTIVTVGIYSFWGRTKTRKYIWSHMTFMNDRLEYTGTGAELFVSFLKVTCVFLAFYSLNFAAAKWAPLLIYPLAAVAYVIFFLLVGFAQYSARNYRLARTRWRGIRLGMTNARKEYMKTYVIWTLFTMFTGGFLAPFRWIKLRRILVANTRIGNKQLTYTGEVKDIYWKFIGGWFLTGLTFGIYSFWHKARLMRYDYDHTNFGSAKFKCVITGGDLFFVTIIGLMMVVFSAGLATPWALRLWLETYSDTLAVIGTLPLDEVGQGDASASAIGEEVAEFLDVDFGF